MSFLEHLCDLCGLYASIAAALWLSSPWAKAFALVSTFIWAKDLVMDDLREKGVIRRV